MFGSDKKENTNFGKIETLISKDTKVEGYIEAMGTLRIDGTVKGGVRQADGLIIGETGVVEGDIHSTGVSISGKVEGNIFSDTNLELLPESTVIGDIETVDLSISNGATFNGKCTMITEEQTSENSSSQQEKNNKNLNDKKLAAEQPT